MSFANESAVRLTQQRTASFDFEAQFGPGWEQGRGAYGGLVLGTLYRACDQSLSAEAKARATLRSMTGEIFAPVLPEPMTIVSEVLRVGNNVTTVQGRIVQGGEAKATAVCVFGAPRPNAFDQNQIAKPSPTPHWRELPVLPVRPPLGPNFGQHLEFRANEGLPFSGKKHASTCAWVRFLDVTDWSTAHLIGLSDATWPTLYVEASAPRPMATVTFMMELFLDAPAVDAHEPVLHIGKTLVVKDGYLAEQRELWSPAGELVALSHQTIVVIQ